MNGILKNSMHNEFFLSMLIKKSAILRKEFPELIGRFFHLLLHCCKFFCSILRKGGNKYPNKSIIKNKRRNYNGNAKLNLELTL